MKYLCDIPVANKTPMDFEQHHCCHYSDLTFQFSQSLLILLALGCAHAVQSRLVAYIVDSGLLPGIPF